MDDLGAYFVSKLDIRDRSPAARQDKYSLFGEMTQAQMHNYRPDQIARLLQQRENVRSQSLSGKHR
jgi:hypothetical protein